MSLLLIAVFMANFTGGYAANAQSPAPQTVIAIFADHSIPDKQWSALFAAIHSELASNDPDLLPLAGLIGTERSTAQLQLVRGDHIAPGLSVGGNSISVYLHGDCASTSAPRIGFHTTPTGALGWVQRHSGQIEPFIHINCTLLTQILRGPALRHNSEDVDHIVAVAIARVLLHEWLHIVTQNPHHAHSGIAKAEFTVNDLIADRSQHMPRSAWPEPAASFPAPSSGAHGK